MRLETYKDVNNLTYKDLVKLTSVPLPTLHRICDSNYVGYCVKLVDAHKIVQGIGSLVSYEDLLPRE